MARNIFAKSWILFWIKHTKILSSLFATTALRMTLLVFYKEYASKNSRIKAFENGMHLGFRKNFEKAISFCSSEYIAFCDQDDIWYKDHLKILIDNID